MSGGVSAFDFLTHLCRYFHQMLRQALLLLKFPYLLSAIYVVPLYTHGYWFFSYNLYTFAAPDNAGTAFVFAFGANTYTGGSLEVYVLTQKEYPVAFNYTRNGAVEVILISLIPMFTLFH